MRPEPLQPRRGLVGRSCGKGQERVNQLARRARVDDEAGDRRAPPALGQRCHLVALDLRVVVAGGPRVVRRAVGRGAQVARARLGANRQLGARRAGARAEQHAAHVVAVDRRQARPRRAVVGRVDARKAGKRRVPVPQRDQPLELGAAHRRRQPAARGEGVAADAALPVVHLASLERIVIRAAGAIEVDGPTVVGREDDEQVVPHAPAPEQAGRVGHHCSRHGPECAWCERQAKGCSASPRGSSPPARLHCRRRT